jgi:hypothetical protein
VILTWAGLLAGSLFAFNYMKIGLEQQLVLPTGSYLKTYFDQQAELGEAGPPVYIVLQNVNYTHPDVSGRMRGVGHTPPPSPVLPAGPVPGFPLSSHRPCSACGLCVHPLSPGPLSFVEAQTTSAIQKIINTLAASPVIERPITNWLDAFNDWDSPTTADNINVRSPVLAVRSLPPPLAPHMCMRVEFAACSC